MGGVRSRAVALGTAAIAVAMSGCGPGPLRTSGPGPVGPVTYEAVDTTGGMLLELALPERPAGDDTVVRGRTSRDIVVTWVGPDCPVTVTATVFLEATPDRFLVELAETDACATDAGRVLAVRLAFDRDVDPAHVTVEQQPVQLVPMPSR